MAGSLNKATVIGNIGQDPEIKTLQNGGKSESWKDRATGEKKEKTEWHRVVVFTEGLVKVIESYVKKGTKIYLEGQLQTRKWVDDSGIDKYTTEIVLQGFTPKLIIMDSRAGSGERRNDGGSRFDHGAESSKMNAKKSVSDVMTNDTDDEIPF